MCTVCVLAFIPGIAFEEKKRSSQKNYMYSNVYCTLCTCMRTTKLFRYVFKFLLLLFSFMLFFYVSGYIDILIVHRDIYI